jgi:hypothetical protein
MPLNLSVDTFVCWEVKTMEISANGAIGAALEQKQSATLQQVQVSMFKKSLDMNSEAALAMISSVTQGTPNTASNPPNLGQNIDTTA